MDSVMSVLSFLEQISLNDDSPFPLVFTPKSDCLTTLSDTVSFIEQYHEELLSDLLCSGAILFRDFPIEDAEVFDIFTRAFKWTVLPYIGGAAPRRQVISIVYTSNESPPSELISFHHEMAQVPKFPEYLMFFCEISSKIVGETPIAYSPMIYNRIKEGLPDFVQKLGENLVRYTRILPNGDDPQSAIGRGRQSTYQTQDHQYAEQVCREQGTAAYTGWSDKRNDGKIMNEEDIFKYTAILDEFSVSFPWKQGDILLIDNRQVLHVRKSFEPPRRILAALFQ